MSPRPFHVARIVGGRDPTPVARPCAAGSRRLALLALVATCLGAGSATVLAQPEHPSPPRITTHADKTRLSTVEALGLTVEVVARPGQEVEIDPPLVSGGALGEWTIASVRRDAPVLNGDGVLHRWTASLEPFLPGEVVVPALSVRMAAPDAAPAEPGVASDPIAVVVTSVLDAVEPFQPGQPPMPLDPPAAIESTGWPLWTLAIAGAVGIASGAAGVLAMRPTPKRLIRRRFEGLRRDASQIMGASATGRGGGDAAHRAAALLRRVAQAAAGSRGLAATPLEFATVLGPALAGVADEEVARAQAVLAWSERCVYAGIDSSPPPMPDLVAIVRAAEGEAIRGATIPTSERARAGAPDRKGSASA